MGAQPSSAALYEVMNFALRGIPSVQIYCDDIFIHTKGNEYHLDILEQLFSRLQYYRLKIACKKCKLMFSSVIFLGYHISNTGIKPEGDKLKVLKEMTYPVDVKGVRQFLGFCNFFQRFIPNYSLYSSRLSSLLRKNSNWSGKEEQEEQCT